MYYSFDSKVNYALLAVCFLTAISVLGGSNYFALILLYSAIAAITLSIIYVVKSVLPLRSNNTEPSNMYLQRRDTINSKEVGTIHTLKEMMEVPAYIRKQSKIGFPIYKATMNDVEKYNRNVRASSEMNNAITAL